jgi:rod shape-determining protein MreB
LSLNGVVYADSLRVAGDTFNESIVKYVRNNHDVIIGEITAEKIKEEVGSAVKSKPIKRKTYIGRSVLTGLPTEFVMTNDRVEKALREPLAAIISAVRTALEKTPPELASDIAKNGVMLTGGGALLGGLDQLIKDKTNLDAHIAKDPLTCVVSGGNMALEMISKNNMSFLSAE